MTTVLPMRSAPRKDFELSLDEIAREGARRLLVQALNLEVEDYINYRRIQIAVVLRHQESA